MQSKWGSLDWTNCSCILQLDMAVLKSAGIRKWVSWLKQRVFGVNPTLITHRSDLLFTQKSSRVSTWSRTGCVADHQRMHNIISQVQLGFFFQAQFYLSLYLFSPCLLQNSHFCLLRLIPQLLLYLHVLLIMVSNMYKSHHDTFPNLGLERPLIVRSDEACVFSDIFRR